LVGLHFLAISLSFFGFVSTWDYFWG